MVRVHWNHDNHQPRVHGDHASATFSRVCASRLTITVETFDYEIAKPMEPGLKGEATITSIEEMKAVEVFGTRARQPEQVLFVIYGKVNRWEGRIGTINKPASRQISAKSKLAKFKQRYGQFPRIGMKVQVEVNAAGYWAMII